MLKSRLLAGVALATLCLPIAALSPGLPFGATTAQAQSASVSFNLFFDQLEPHGVWVRHARYNYVFCPTGVDASWRPYSHGRWLYIEGRGWYFASDEPFAWATYHYGRWFADRTLGWCWVPGTKWAPAWVSWRRSDSVIGWAPLPPENDGYAISIEVSRRDLPEGYWVFVPTERFVEPDLSVSIVIGSQQPDYFAQTQFLGPVVIEGDLVINNVIEVNYIEQATGQQVIAYQPETAAEPAAQAVDVDAQAIVVFDQDIAGPTEEVAPPEAVEEADAAATIETEGGTAGATAELPAETDAPADAQPAEAEPTAEAPAEQPATEAAPAAEGEATPATGTEEAAPASDPNGPASTEPAAEEEAAPAAPADDELVCAPEVRVDGKCPPLADEAAQPEQAPAEQTPAEPAEAAPAAAPEAAPAPEARAPAEPEPATEPEAAPAPEATTEAEPAPEVEAAPAEAEAAPAEKPFCSPEVMMDGKCPPLPDGQPAQQ
jgi:hypothetical protein